MNISQYFKDTKGEMKHVSWPTRRQVVVFTVAVIVISIFTGLYLGLFDFIFKKGLTEVFFNAELPVNTESVEVDLGNPVLESESDADALETTQTFDLDVTPNN